MSMSRAWPRSLFGHERQPAKRGASDFFRSGLANREPLILDARLLRASEPFKHAGQGQSETTIKGVACRQGSGEWQIKI